MDNSSLCCSALCDIVRSLPAVFLLRLMPGATIRIPVEDHDYFYVFAGNQPHEETGGDLDQLAHIDTQWRLQDNGHDDTGLQPRYSSSQQIVNCTKTIDVSKFQEDLYVYHDLFSDDMRRKVHHASKHLLKTIPVEILSRMVSPVVLHYSVTVMDDGYVLHRYPLYSQWNLGWKPDVNKLKYHIMTYALECFAHELIRFHESRGTIKA